MKDLRKKEIEKIEEEARAQLTLAQSGQDDYAWKRYQQLIEYARTLNTQ